MIEAGKPAEKRMPLIFEQGLLRRRGIRGLEKEFADLGNHHSQDGGHAMLTVELRFKEDGREVSFESLADELAVKFARVL